MENTLLLSAGYEPLKILDWRRAVTLVLLGKVEVLEEYVREVRSPSMAIPLPAVVRLHRYVRRHPQRVKFSRQNIFFRDEYTCQYCHKKHPTSQLTYDHIVPKSRGGRTTWTNIVTSCVRCNLKKGNKPLSTLNYRLLKEPEEPKWLPTLSQFLNVDSAPSVWRAYLGDWSAQSNEA